VHFDEDGDASEDTGRVTGLASGIGGSGEGERVRVDLEHGVECRLNLCDAGDVGLPRLRR
jgi:hypothetical protein